MFYFRTPMMSLRCHLAARVSVEKFARLVSVAPLWELPALHPAESTFTQSLCSS